MWIEAKPEKYSLYCELEPLTERPFEEEAGKEIVPEEKQSAFDFFWLLSVLQSICTSLLNLCSNLCQATFLGSTVQLLTEKFRTKRTVREGRI
ncbi:predicted protein [Methanosarcina acetivorans C2A]|uniref:Uncharacterized protein n=1 Tax=Methanosarcina acetivorans (strain ATCC 35395 / DSM 2834 / JCM 12185 / C2A) TaxID=188937 RepID=Q8TQY7_METAC|nr:predicted protein [Methanosarcina acetivorans C2A]